MMTYNPYLFSGGSGGGGGITTYGWDDDLDAVPSFDFDTTLSSGITEAQLSAGLTVSAGALIINMDDMLTAGASSGALAVAWLTGKTLQAPTQVYVAGAGAAANTGSGTNNGLAGLALYYYADAGDAAPSNAPGGSAALASMEWGLASGGARSTSRQNWGAAAASTANANFIAGTIDACRLTNGRTGIVRSGASYPPTGGLAATDSRATSSAAFADDHRLRLALIVRLTGSTSLPTISIRQARVDYRPAS